MEITAFFSDIKGFSTFSEKFREDPKGLMKLLNRYLSTVTPVLTAQGACIDKYIGDAVVALFGAPIRYPDHALRACRGALAVQVALTALRAELQAEGLPDVYTRIGLNTDTMLVGNIGSAQLIDYTAIGDGMNLAARLEGANKQFGSLILMGENTYLAVKDQVIAREVDVVRVAGKHLPTRIYELVGLVAPEGGAGVVSPTKLEVLAGYQQALVRYRALDFAGAKALLGSVALLDPADGPSNTLLHRCEKFMVTPPPAGWDGVTELEK
jgi:adenylate cyclase